MAQLRKLLPCKQEDLRLVPGLHEKKKKTWCSGSQIVTVNPSVGEAEMAATGTHWQAGPVYLTSFRP